MEKAGDNKEGNRIMEEKLFTVWVGGLEINDHYLTEQEAHRLANLYRNLGYEDIVLDRIHIGNVS